jgi:hypothetical protein
MADWPPKPSTLKGPAVTLESLRIEHVEALQVAAEDGRLWEGPFGFVPRPAHMSAYAGQALKEADEQKSLPIAVRLNDKGTVVGTTGFLNIQQNRRRMEIGFTWYARSCQRSVVNTECKLLLLEQAFDALDCIAIADRDGFFWESKALLSAVELGLFTELAKGEKSSAELCRALSLNGRGAQDLLDALLSMGLLGRSSESFLQRRAGAAALEQPEIYILDTWPRGARP